MQASQSISSILIAEGPGARLMNRRNRFCNRRMEIGATRRVLIEHKSSINRARIIERFLPIRAQSKDDGAGKTRHYITPLIARTSRVQSYRKLNNRIFFFRRKLQFVRSRRDSRTFIRDRDTVIIISYARLNCFSSRLAFFYAETRGRDLYILYMYMCVSCKI